MDRSVNPYIDNCIIFDRNYTNVRACVFIYIYIYIIIYCNNGKVSLIYIPIKMSHAICSKYFKALVGNPRDFRTDLAIFVTSEHEIGWSFDTVLFGQVAKGQVLECSEMDTYCHHRFCCIAFCFM